MQIKWRLHLKCFLNSEVLLRYTVQLLLTDNENRRGEGQGAGSRCCPHSVCRVAKKQNPLARWKAQEFVRKGNCRICCDNAPPGLKSVMFICMNCDIVFLNFSFFVTRAKELTGKYIKSLRGCISKELERWNRQSLHGGGGALVLCHLHFIEKRHYRKSLANKDTVGICV